MTSKRHRITGWKKLVVFFGGIKGITKVQDSPSSFPACGLLAYIFPSVAYVPRWKDISIPGQYPASAGLQPARHPNRTIYSQNEQHTSSYARLRPDLPRSTVKTYKSDPPLPPSDLCPSPPPPFSFYLCVFAPLREILMNLWTSPASYVQKTNITVIPFMSTGLTGHHPFIHL
jgi:hypothetical protein